MNYEQCKKFRNRNVRIVTRCGRVLVGKIVKVDGNCIHLDTSCGRARTSSFGFFNPIITLALFDLLAIALLF